MLGKVWYEGYAKPEYVWQSTGATDDFEPKMSLVPLIFGTIKATFYALMFAIPLAVMGALYTSQFVHPTIKAKVKPTVEIMAALPSVVIGFIAGLWLASRVEAHLVPVLLLIVFLPLVRHGGRPLLGPPALRPAAAAQAGHGGAGDPAAARCWAAGWPSRSGPGSRRASSATTSSTGSRRPSASSTTSATAWWSASPWASR